MERKTALAPFVISLILCIIFLLFGLSLIGKGFTLKDTYNYENKYVGGDAYNYIINGTYFSGYCALGGTLLICSTLCGTCALKTVPAKRTTSLEEAITPSPIGQADRSPDLSPNDSDMTDNSSLN